VLELARDRTSGAYPYLVTPDYVASAREILGGDRQIAVLLDVIPEADPARAREIAREGGMRFLAWASATTTSPGCQTASSTA
jgi:hypothetical protein